MTTITNLVVEQGATFSSDVTVTNDDGTVFDLTGHNSFGQMTKGFDTSNARTTFTTSNANSTGIITISLTAIQTAALDEGRYVYDVVIVKTADSTVTRVAEGIVTVNSRVTTNY